MAKSKNLGPYELRGELGRGAMAKVWRAWDPKLEREVAIKEPLFDERLSPAVLEEMGSRFVKEGKAAARLNHPGIVTIYAADVYDSRPVIVMELIDGITLSEMLDSGSMTPQTSLDALDQLLDAVGYAHSQGVVHRDIKPDNIFVTKDGRIKLSDFGIAHMDDSSMTHATQLGTVLGTPGYMAPEQATGSAIDNRTDLFAVGTIAYEMLTGKNPFGAGDGTNFATLIYRIVNEPVPELPDAATEGLPADIRPAVLAALNKNPDDRPQDAASFKAMLHGAASPVPGMKPAPKPASYSTQQASSSSKKWLPYALVGALGVIIVGIVFAFATSGGNGDGLVDSSTFMSDGVTSDGENKNGDEEQQNEQDNAPTLDIVAIQNALDQSGAKGDFSVAVLDLRTDALYSTDFANTPFFASALINVPLLYAIDKKIEANELSLNDTVTFRHSVSGRGIYAKGDDGKSMTLREVLSVMLKYSDNNATNTLLDYVGISEVNKVCNQNGYASIRLERGFVSGETSLENYVGAEDVARMVGELYKNSKGVGTQFIQDNFLINDDATRKGLLRNIPQSVSYFNHNGFAETRFNEVVIIDSDPYSNEENRLVYVMVFLSQKGNGEASSGVAATVGLMAYKDLAA